ncbi:MAG: UxaA family hydrolase, partial [Deltaproteobacteria bacterium]|nr:UxaA family hydrolase [Deltaproteobacteria bacterium]
MKTKQGRTIKLSPEDNVMVALNELAPGSVVVGADIRSRDRIPAGHKVAISRINRGSPIIKYGQTIGFASKNILPGDHVHTQNTV